MRLEYYPAEQLKQDILTIVERHLDLSRYRVFFFGSRVTGKGTDRSDIDVGIEGPQSIPADRFMSIEEEIEQLPTLYSIDMVDFSTISQTFRTVAYQKKEYLH